MMALAVKNTDVAARRTEGRGGEGRGAIGCPRELDLLGDPDCGARIS